MCGVFFVVVIGGGVVRGCYEFCQNLQNGRYCENKVDKCVESSSVAYHLLNNMDLSSKGKGRIYYLPKNLSHQ